MSITHVQEHVDLIAKHEQEFLAQRTSAERAGDAVADCVGSFKFVGFHVLIFAAWMVWNSVPGVRHFDARPFSLLATLVGLEAILLASVILMRQSRMARRAEERDHLMLQILLLTEKEMTTALGVQRQVAGQVGLKEVAENPEVQALSEHTPIDEVAQTIRENMPDVAGKSGRPREE